MGTKLDISGKKYGELIAIRNTEKKKNNSFLWEFKCSCGNYVVRPVKCVRYNHNKGMINSCGCIQRKVESPVNEMRNSYKQNAKKRGYTFNLSVENFHKLVHGNCHYCGAEPSRRNHRDKRYFKVNGIDRLRNDKGYCIHNCVPCCTRCNIMKRDMDYHHFMEMVTRIYLNQNNGNDNDTRSIYRRERNCGMRGSSILKHVYDMVEIDNLQKADIKALINALVDEHVHEEDLNEA